MKLSVRKCLVVLLACALPSLVMAVKKQQPLSDREYWCQHAYYMARPVLDNMS